MGGYTVVIELILQSTSSWSVSDIFAFATIAISIFAAFKLDSINRNIGELATEIKNHKEIFIELKSEIKELSNRVFDLEKEVITLNNEVAKTKTKEDKDEQG